MFRKKLIVETWLSLLNFFLPILAALFTLLLRFRAIEDASPASRFEYKLLVVVVTVTWILATSYYHLGKLKFGEPFGKRLIKASLITSTVLFATTFTYRSAEYSRAFVLLYPIVLFALAIVVQKVFHMAPALTRRSYPVAIIGSHESALQAARELSSSQFFSGRLAGFISLPGMPMSAPGAEVLSFDRLSEAVSHWHCEELYVAIRPMDLELFADVQDQIEALCLPTRMIVGGIRHSFQNQIHTIGGLEVINLFEHPAESRDYVVWKRVFDIAFSLAVMVACLPLFLIISLAIKLSSPGPVLFRQERIGFKNKPFIMYKFRTMTCDATGECHKVHTKHADPRITSVGQILRRTSLDELPQFLNVLKGEMSVVGPRPELTFFVHKFREEIPSYLVRHHVMCGITGWAQVNGLRGSHTSIPQRVEFDLEYVKNWSLALDLQIIAKTVASGFAGKNAV